MSAHAAGPGRNGASAPWGKVLQTPEEAGRLLERMSRYCAYGCPRTADCLEGACDGWRMEQAAAEVLVRSWLDAER